MSRRFLSGIVGLFVLMGFVAGSAIAERADQPEAVAEAIEVEGEGAKALEVTEEQVITENFGELMTPAAKIDNNPGLTCTCDCVCPASGASEVQTFSVPPWIAGCGQFNGDACAISGPDTCNTPRRYENCRF